ncbi:MAG TPA: response regulator [Gemmatimonadales bacterium]|nr:response regulator [Gemmatimonadales bacterium]
MARLTQSRHNTASPAALGVARVLHFDGGPSFPPHRTRTRRAQADDGQAGLRLWHKRGADLVITDICMPNRTGIEVILELRALAPGLALVAISGGAESRVLDLLGTARLAGAVRAVPKPFTGLELLAPVHEVLQHHPRPPSS